MAGPDIRDEEIPDLIPGAARGDVAVTIPGEAGGADAPLAPADPAAELESLRGQMAARDAENARLREEAAAERRAAAEARGETRDSNLVAITNSIELHNQQLTKYEDEIAELQAAGDYKGAAKVMREMARTQSRVDQLENGRVVIEQGVLDRPKVEGRVPPRQADAPAPSRTMSLDEKVEDLCSRVTPASAAWLRTHKDVMNDGDALAGAHEYATKVKKAAQDSPEYFRIIEQELGISQREAAPAPAPAPRASVPAARAPVYDAPASRSAASPAGKAAQRVVNLSPAQQDAAADMGMTNEEYVHFLQASN